VFVAENVSGLVKGTAKGYFIEILRELRACGYRVRAKLLDAQSLGVPQARQRLIFVGVRGDLGLDPAFPSPLPYRYSIRDVMPWIRRINGRTGPQFTRVESEIDEPMNAITVQDPAQTRYEVEAAAAVRFTSRGHGWFSGGERSGDAPAPTVLATNQGGAWSNYEVTGLPPADTDPETGKDLSLTPAYDGRYNRLRRLSDGPSPTVLTHDRGFNAVNTSARRFTLLELRRICGFPDDFILTGTYEQRWERLGRAVPPVMMSHIAATIRDQILAKVDV
jgi:DNA (cytosine-5)-methyltransferase 1